MEAFKRANGSLNFHCFIAVLQLLIYYDLKVFEKLPVLGKLITFIIL